MGRFLNFLKRIHRDVIQDFSKATARKYLNILHSDLMVMAAKDIHEEDREEAKGLFPTFVKAVLERSGERKPRVLEIGSRMVTGQNHRKHFGDKVEYTGVDIHPGPNVDVVLDAHELSSALKGQKFDAVYSMAVFEHLAMPWKVALEINKVLEPGGLVYVATHPTWPPHELP